MGPTHTQRHTSTHLVGRVPEHVCLQVVLGAAGIGAERALEGLHPLMDPDVLLQLWVGTNEHSLAIRALVGTSAWEERDRKRTRLQYQHSLLILPCILCLDPRQPLTQYLFHSNNHLPILPSISCLDPRQPLTQYLFHSNNSSLILPWIVCLYPWQQITQYFFQH